MNFSNSGDDQTGAGRSESNLSHGTVSNWKTEKKEIDEYLRLFPSRRVLTVNEALKARLLQASSERMSDASNAAKLAWSQAPSPVYATPFSSAYNPRYYPINQGSQCFLPVNQGKRKRVDEAEDMSNASEIRIHKQRKIVYRVPKSQSTPQSVPRTPASEHYKPSYQSSSRRMF